ncbi:hypothetical protein QUF80_05150 [Desulfococcaceae bacterium HSG8]|nr:hypothetical protein [Desulfococcaceae bacterium HSG8]
MEHYKNYYTKEEDPVLWELHKIRHEIAGKKQSSTEINTIGYQLIKKYKLNNLRIVRQPV